MVKASATAAPEQGPSAAAAATAAADSPIADGGCGAAATGLAAQHSAQASVLAAAVRSL